MKDNSIKSKLMLILSMFIFGTIGVFRKYIPLSSAVIAFARGVIGTLFLIIILKIKGKKISWTSVKSNLVILIFSGAFLGLNWILLFEAYQYTSVAIATLCYYMAPIFVILVSPIFLKENLTVKKIICVTISLLGMILVSGVVGEQFSGISELKGVILGLGAAALYATVIILNKKITNIESYDKTIIQLSASAIILLPYIILNNSDKGILLTPFIIMLIIVVGVLHTGIAYTLYFGAMKDLTGQTVALFSYIDPIVAILLSAFLLKEPMNYLQIIGTILVISATMASELNSKISVKK